MPNYSGSFNDWEAASSDTDFTSGNNENSAVTPVANRGVQNTCGEVFKEGLTSLVDWVSCTLKDTRYTIREIIVAFGLPVDKFDEGKGVKGWEFGLRFGDMVFCWGGNPHYHFEFTGQGCRQFESISGVTWHELFSMALDLNGHFTRLDVAIDDVKGYFSIEQIIRILRKRQVRSRFRKARIMEEIDIHEKVDYGKTVYLGRPGSEIQIRFYDKRQERIGKGFEVLETLEIWNRTEVQTRGERASVLAEILSSREGRIGEAVVGVLRTYVEFLVKGKDSNIARWKVQPWWDKFLGAAAELRLTAKSPENTLVKKHFWVNHQVAKTIAEIAVASHDQFGEIMQEFVRKGYASLTEGDLDFIERNLDVYLEHVRHWLKGD